MDEIIIMESAQLSKNEKNKYIIYGHRCTMTNKWYIGQTVYTDDLEKRFGKNGSKYLKKTKKGNYNHPKFANAINKYGWENFEHVLLEYVNDDTIDEREIFWISEKDSLKNGYNTTNGGKHSHKLTEENKAKISNPVTMKDKDGKIIKEFKSAKAAAEYIGLFNNSPIIECCKGYRKTTKGYYWEYKNGKSIREENIKKDKLVLQGYHVRTAVLQIDPKTKEVVNKFDSAITAEEKTNIKASCIYRCCRHERLTTGGYIWEYDLSEVA